VGRLCIFQLGFLDQLADVFDGDRAMRDGDIILGPIFLSLPTVGPSWRWPTVQQCAGGCDDIEMDLFGTTLPGAEDTTRRLRSCVVLYALNRLKRSMELMEVNSD